MKKQFSVSMLIALMATSCASIKSIDEIKTTTAGVTKNAYQGGKEANSKFFFNEFNDEYEDDNKIKKIGIAYYQIGWDSKEWRKNSRFMSPDYNAATKDYQNVVDTSMEKLKEKFMKLGYEVLTPSELAAKSATFAALKTANGTFEYSPTSGQELIGLSVKDSRYIHAMTNEGKLVSKINNEAGVDAIVGVYYNDLGTSGSETDLNGTFILGVTSSVSFNLTICVSREKAKAAGVSLGIFGDANHCGQSVGEYGSQYYLPDLRHTDKPEFPMIKEVAFEGMKNAYSAVAEGLVESIYEEGMK